MPVTLYLWSLRRGIARGWHWYREREVSQDTAEAWLSVFRQDEPGVSFTVSIRPPKLPLI